MVSALPPFKPSTKDITIRLRSRFYKATGARPIFKDIFVQANNLSRNPRLDLIMAEHRLQPRIHDGVVTIIHRRKETRFHVFVKNHCRLRQNESIRRWKNSHWKGDVVVMKKGLSDELVNLGPRDGHLADYAAKKFIQRVQQRARFSVPKGLKFIKS
ncbi:hypothetical protein BDZ97DRAFT_1919811 [Flammula alnicola]|nr:hypothetical protein BDZ97DRAFT_1919811 [Flammula alnicola]